MIIPAQGLRIVLAVRPVDFRCGHDALAGLVQNTLGLDPHSGLIVVFRSKRAPTG
ncbi:IS66 family insertion sequence element accessory protein TnpB [Bradyrhizobium elkanii]|uniref:IS66 family insertion sequence element accessory protein TnpB n=1 Tax=Bradyrhizobium elkanii TaxID=29448 RepID=UPI0003819416|nr:transposase [Bradyrhizobium elkanii]